MSSSSDAQSTSTLLLLFLNISPPPANTGRLARLEIGRWKKKSRRSEVRSPAQWGSVPGAVNFGGAAPPTRVPRFWWFLQQTFSGNSLFIHRGARSWEGPASLVRCVFTQTRPPGHQPVAPPTCPTVRFLDVAMVSRGRGQTLYLWPVRSLTSCKMTQPFLCLNKVDAGETRK